MGGWDECYISYLKGGFLSVLSACVVEWVVRVCVLQAAACEEWGVNHKVGCTDCVFSGPCQCCNYIVFYVH